MALTDAQTIKGTRNVFRPGLAVKTTGTDTVLPGMPEVDVAAIILCDDAMVTVLSVLVEAAEGVPAASSTAPAGIEAITVPKNCGALIPLTATLYIAGPPVTVTVLVPGAVPVMSTELPVKPVTGVLNIAVKLTVRLPDGSGWPAAWLIVTVGDLMMP